MTDKAEILAVVQEMGFALTEADFEVLEREMSGKELAGVSGGGTEEGKYSDGVCACVLGGYGDSET